MCSSFAAKQRLYRLAQNVILFRLLDQEFLQEYLLLGQEAPPDEPWPPFDNRARQFLHEWIATSDNPSEIDLCKLSLWRTLGRF